MHGAFAPGRRALNTTGSSLHTDAQAKQRCKVQTRAK